MKRIVMISLAASTLVPAGAAAQPNTVAPPVRWEDVPPARLALPAAAPAGVSWQAPPVQAQQARAAQVPPPLPLPPAQAQLRRGAGPYSMPGAQPGPRPVYGHQPPIYGSGPGMNWDDRGGQWRYDDRGVPVYVGNGDFHPGEEDYAWVEGQRGYGHPNDPRRYGPQQQAQVQPGHGYPYGMVVTETTVTTPTVVIETQYVD